MISSKKLFLVILSALLQTSLAKAQEVIESAPQEAPFVQEENEFDTKPTPEVSDKDFMIEDEWMQSLDQKPAPKTSDKKDPVNLNDHVGDAPLDFEEDPILPAAPPAPVKQKPIPIVRQKPSSKGGVKYIEHPQAAKGLLRIEEDGSYIYKTQDFKSEGKSGTFRLGMMDPPTIVSADGSTTFQSMYSNSSQPLFMFDYEWQPFDNFGKLGVQGGIGLLLTSGRGRFISGSMAGQEAKEEYTFIAVPLNLGLVYRLEWMRKQWLAPYVGAGGTYIGVVEMRDDDAPPSVVGTPGAYGSAGMLFNISALDRGTSFTLANDYGVANLWLSLEYRYLYTFSEDVDFSSNIFAAGVTVDY